MLSPDSSPKPEAPWRRELLLLAALFGLFYFFRLGSAPLANPDEGRYAEVPREMLASGDWVTPRLNGVRYFEKPPFMYWVVALAERTFGPEEWAVRSGPALFGLLGILMVYATGRKLYGQPAGLWAAVVMGTSLLYAALSRLLLLDVAVSVLMTAALGCFILAVQEPPGIRRRWLFYGLYTAAALATLTKGLIGFLVTGAVMFLWLLICGQWRRLRPLYLPTGGLIFLLIAAPWHLFAARANPEWARFYFVHEHWERFTTTQHGRVQPVWFFLPIVILGLFPWMGFLRPSLLASGGWGRRKEAPEAWFFLIWACFILLFFSASQSKLIPYILPVLPPLAILIGKWLASDRSPLREGTRVFAFVCGLLAAALIIAVNRPGLIRDPGQALALRPYAVILAVIFLTGGIAGLWLERNALAANARGRTLGCMAGTLVAAVVVLTFAAPLIQRPGTRDLAIALRPILKDEDRVFHYHGFFHDFTYYTGRVVGLVGYRDELELQFLDPRSLRARFIDDATFLREWAGPGRIFVVVRKRDSGPLMSSAFPHHLIAESQDHYLLSNQP